jgi:hypothetical protein
MQDADSSAHDRYLRLFLLIEERDERIAAAFDDLRRSTAIQRLAAMINLGVITDPDRRRETRISGIGVVATFGCASKPLAASGARGCSTRFHIFAFPVFAILL